MRSLAAHLALALALALAASSAGCFLDFGGDDTCDDGRPRTPLLINPASLACESHPGVDPCSSNPSLTWGACESACRELDEATCVATLQCRVAYDHDCFFGGPCAGSTFLGCYPTDANLDNATGCAGLDAWSCSRHEACAGTYRPSPSCTDGVDQDNDGAIDEADECGWAYVRCVPELVAAPP